MILPKPTIVETQEEFVTRAMSDVNMIREYSNGLTRQLVALSRWNETQFSRDFYVEVEEVPTESTVATPRHSSGKVMAEPGEPLTDPQTQST